MHPQAAIHPEFWRAVDYNKASPEEQHACVGKEHGPGHNEEGGGGIEESGRWVEVEVDAYEGGRGHGC